MIPILLDPWLLKFSPDAPDDQMNARAASLRHVFSVLVHQYPLEILRFISEEEHAEFWGILKKYKGADAREAILWINTLEVAEELHGTPTATITDKPCPDELPPLWLRILAAIGNTDAPPAWRYPMLFIPSIRKANWPDNDEINYTHQGITLTRNLISIEQCQEHKFFLADFDPWRLGFVGEPPEGLLHERAVKCMRLPRPPQIHSRLPLGQFVETLANIRDWRCGSDDSYYYLPTETWNPNAEEKPTWRNATTFSKSQVLAGRKRGTYGYLDRDNRIWLWHEGENHWDVQLAGGDYTKVSYNGKIL